MEKAAGRNENLPPRAAQKNPERIELKSDESLAAVVTSLLRHPQV